MSEQRSATANGSGTETRKAEHIRICLEEQVQGDGIRDGIGSVPISAQCPS